MKTISQIARFRQSVVSYSFKFGVPATVRRFNASRASVYRRYYQYTAIDEYSRFRYVAAFKEQSTYFSAQFLDMLVKAFPFKIECVQTDNGLEFIKEFEEHEKGKMSLFEVRLKQLGIRHKLIKPYTPRHNGKVERSHRKDNEYFYATHKFYSFEDFAAQLAVHNRKYNAFPMRPLNWHSPKDYITDFLKDGLLH